MQETLVLFLGWKELQEKRDRLPTPVFLGFPGGSGGKKPTCKVGDLGLIPGLGRFPGGGHGNLLQYSCLENPCGQRNLADSSPWGCKELDTTEWLSTAHPSIWQLERIFCFGFSDLYPNRHSSQLKMRISLLLLVENLWLPEGWDLTIIILTALLILCFYKFYILVKVFVAGQFEVFIIHYVNS